jgi:hypothetical protein
LPGQVRERARLYHQVRTAHLERAGQLPRATILYANRRYDFAEELAVGLDLVSVKGLSAAGWLLRHPVRILEINEPLMLPAARSTAIALVGLILGRLVGRPRTRVVSYAIENLDPRSITPHGIKGRLGRRLDLTLARLIWRRLDRVAYGTAAAAELYAAVLPPKGQAPAPGAVPRRVHRTQGPSAAA